MPQSVVSTAQRPAGPGSGRPDLILYGGKVITVDPRFTVAEAVAVTGDRFSAVGRDREVLARAGPGTRCVDLAGRAVMPGIIDAHFRLLDRATAQLHGADVSLAESVADILDAVRERARRLPAGAVITSNAGWYPQMLKEGRAPSREELDRAAPDHPVVLSGEFTHLNSLALRRFGISRTTRQPEYGWIEKADARGVPSHSAWDEGEPTGVLMGDAALLTRCARTDLSPELKQEALVWALGECATAGVTSVREGGLDPGDLAHYQKLAENDELPLRVSVQLAMSTAPPVDEVLASLERFDRVNPFGDHRLRVDRVAYLFADDDYHRMDVTPPIRGQRVPADRVHRYFRDRCCPLDKIEQIVTGMAERGFSGGILAGGDRAIGAVLGVLERADAAAGLSERRWVLSQAVYPRPEHHPRMRDLGLVLTPMWHHFYYYPALAHYHGTAFAQTMDPFRSLRAAGVHVGLGSDISKIPLNYFAGLSYLHTRQTLRWGPVNPGEALSREEALRMLTIDNAYVTFEEDVKGSIEPGKLADLAVLSADPLTVPGDRIPAVRALLTMVGGRVVHRAADYGDYDCGDCNDYGAPAPGRG
ncbi:amidohydrolase [Streptomyces sp. PR69]|uniref:amidohydrolase n=1 Tax=Streptomyces sp. PR69 TaxID=2984950 RepID=UPI002265050B|nr:amidohydrolase [Streptomyces sp. PR69]